MTVKKIGRPSKSFERTAQIMSAMRAEVAQRGLDNATLEGVGARSGLGRTLVAHYFPRRRDLVDHFVTDAVGRYGDAMIAPDDRGSIAERVPSFFRDGIYADADDLAIWLELVARSTRDPDLRERLRTLWESRWLPRLETQLAEAFPAAGADRHRATAYALACLFEAHWSLRAQGLTDDDRADAASAAALHLVAALSA